jgi:hypothetical protein
MISYLLLLLNSSQAVHIIVSSFDNVLPRVATLLPNLPHKRAAID